jgi:pimeloyl-ACP methyl ester carboxylesterase
MSDQQSLFRFDEKNGNYSVGLNVVEQYDYSRAFRSVFDELGGPYRGERARPLQTLVWYPALPSSAKTMTVRAYMDLWLTETSFGQPNSPARCREWLSGMNPSLESALWAVRGASPAPGRFPVVIYAPSFSSVSWENADLCEYLASHGFVVIAGPSLGATTRSMTADVLGVRTQAADISFLIGYARELPQADVSKVAVAGFSWGGISNVCAAAQDNRIRALIALDGSLRYWPGIVRLAGVQPEHMSIPMASFSKTEWTLEEQARYLSRAQMDGPNVLNAWKHGDLLDVHMLGMTHREFSSMFQRNEDVWKDFHDPEFPDRRRADYGREEGISGYACVARYVLQFLNAYFNRDPAARAYLKRTPAENGMPRHYMDVSYRPATASPPSVEGLRAEVGRQGFGRAQEISTEWSKRDPHLQLDENGLKGWAEELLDLGRPQDALVLLNINVQAHPDSSAAHAARARALELAGQRQAAIEGYRRALEVNEVNPDASRRLRELESSPGRAE